ncbi:hypothetical protein [Nevskia sp.]|uniref:hypothetical protein n=1 Tax=Nevskia sp. TaxID=1929292 RepID=UPI0025F4E47D|nr:hypothetical protein [Nevskia sp.]
MTAAIPTMLQTDRVALEHFERVTSEHARMSELLRQVHAAYYGSAAAATRVALEYGLNPDCLPDVRAGSDAAPDWLVVLRQMLGPDIDALLTEVYSDVVVR